MMIALSGASRADCGAKAATLARLWIAGLPVPDGFIVPAGAGHSDAAGQPVDDPGIGPAARSQIAEELVRLGDQVVAVRSSAADEDTADASAAGLYTSIIGVHGTDAVCEAVAACRRSAGAARVGHYRRRGGGAGEPVAMSVLVQVMIEAEVSGVMFTPESPDGSTRIESSWGLGPPVVGGSITPDAFEVDATGDITAVIGTKSTRVDSDTEHQGVTTRSVPKEMQTERTLDDETLKGLVALGTRASDILGGRQDIEWAIADGTIWIVQARPVTACLPTMTAADAGSDAHAGAEVRRSEAPGQETAPGHGVAPGREMTPGHEMGPRGELVGTPGSHGVVTARARIVPGPSAFSTVRPGEVVVCPYTDPAWTPLFSIAAGVITEVGGALSHAAIVAREYGIPAVLGADRATSRIANGDLVTIDGSTGAITLS